LVKRLKQPGAFQATVRVKTALDLYSPAEMVPMSEMMLTPPMVRSHDRPSHRGVVQVIIFAVVNVAAVAGA
jgi:hypothetical protein